MKLQHWQEALGLLIDVTVEDGGLRACFEGFDVCLPPEHLGKLRKLVGRRVGILRTDLEGREFLFRILRDRS